MANLRPVTLIPLAICHRCQRYRWKICHWYQPHQRYRRQKFAAGIIDNDSKLATSIINTSGTAGAVDTVGKFATDVNVTDRNFERRELNQRSKSKIPCTMYTYITKKEKICCEASAK
jgi:hypothetical protein